jgi:hypothetical protein
MHEMYMNLMEIWHCWKPYENIRKKKRKKSWLSLVVCRNVELKWLMETLNPNPKQEQVWLVPNTLNMLITNKKSVV